jgi:hypothetical protein
MISHPPKRPTCIDLPNAFSRYPNIAEFHAKYCAACSQSCDIPSIEMFSCMIKKLTKKQEEK